MLRAGPPGPRDPLGPPRPPDPSGPTEGVDPVSAYSEGRADPVRAALRRSLPALESCEDSHSSATWGRGMAAALRTAVARPVPLAAVAWLGHHVSAGRLGGDPLAVVMGQFAADMVAVLRLARGDVEMTGPDALSATASGMGRPSPEAEDPVEIELATERRGLGTVRMV